MKFDSKNLFKNKNIKYLNHLSSMSNKQIICMYEIFFKVNWYPKITII